MSDGLPWPRLVRSVSADQTFASLFSTAVLALVIHDGLERVLPRFRRDPRQMAQKSGVGACFPRRSTEGIDCIQVLLAQTVTFRALRIQGNVLLV
jgi:hypothetical protein